MMTRIQFHKIEFSKQIKFKENTYIPPSIQGFIRVNETNEYMSLKYEMVMPNWWMLNGVNAAQWRTDGMMEVGEGRVVGDVRVVLWISMQ